MGSRLEKNSEAVRKRIESHTFDDETGEEYEGSKFGGFNEYYRRKKLKLQNLDVEIRSLSVGTPQIFKGIVAYVNGYTQPSLNELHRMIVTHGGGFMQYLDSKTSVTHIIAANITPKKAVEFKRYRVVRPNWIVDSINGGKVQPWENYKVIDEGTSQQVLSFSNGKIGIEAAAQSRSYRDHSNGSWYAAQVKDVAENLDDGDIDVNYPKSQPVTTDGMAAYPNPLGLGHNQVVRSGYQENEIRDSESLEVSSSLEESLKAADSISLLQQDKKTIAKAEDVPKNLIFSDGNPDQIMFNAPTSVSPGNKPYSLLDDPVSASKRMHALTAEEHNAILLSDPNVRKSSTANPNFLRQYYSESRLHHLSTWKADLKARLQQMATERSPSQKQNQKKKPGSRSYIMHVDFDSFFCAVSLKSAPEYVDKPAVVAHGTGVGSEIASCNYPARSFGIKNGMWMKNALKLCPDIKILPYDFPAYDEASRSFYTAILDVGGIVQSVSVDEALVDISSLCILADGNDGHCTSEESIWLEQQRANEIARDLRQCIKQITGCAVSVGIGGNILLAKVALRKAKPAGQYLLKPEEVLHFIGELLVQDLPGVARSIGGKLEEIDIKYVKDVRSLSKERLMSVLGPKTGEKIWDYSRGIDKLEVGEQVVRKSVSAEINWGIRFISQQEAEDFVQNLCEELHRRLLDQGVMGTQLTIKIMRRAADAPLDPPKHLGHGKCDTFNKSIVLGVATNSADIIGREAISVLRSYGFSPGELRGLGVQMTKLEPFRGSTSNRPDGSQKKINFITANTPKLIRKETEDIDDPESPQKSRITPIHPATLISRTNAADNRANKPLNLTGTQFIIPTQLDSTVLAELPLDMRSRLLAQCKSAPTSRAQSPIIKSRSQSPAGKSVNTAIPSHLDAEIFEFLPEDAKAEVLASYKTNFMVHGAQPLLPQSLHKARVLAPSKEITTPTEKQTGLLFRGGKSKGDSSPILTQSNFVTGGRGIGNEAFKESDDSEDYQSDSVDLENLAALPEDVRVEIVAENHRSRLARPSGLALTTPHEAHPVPSLLTDQWWISLPPQLEKPTFTTRELSSLPELRDSVSAWHRGYIDEGPHVDDVTAMEHYLQRVVLEERDMAKAVAIVKWLVWLVDSAAGKPGGEKGERLWKAALERLKESVRMFFQQRGVGPPDMT